MAESSSLCWKVGDPLPKELSGDSSPVLSALIPRTVAWITVDGTDFALLEGFSGGAYTPPSLFFASGALPPSLLEALRTTRTCTVSAATTHQPPASFAQASLRGGHLPRTWSCEALGFATQPTKDGFPNGVSSSPVQMCCSLEIDEELSDSGESLIVLVVETFVISKRSLSPPTEALKSRPNVVAKLDAALIQPVVSLGHGLIVPLEGVYSMPRPTKGEDGTSWTSAPFAQAEPSLGAGEFDFETIEWSFRQHGGTSPLGYNATTALIMPRLIGWLSSYNTDTATKIPHLAPYSFFSDVSRSPTRPMVAFSGYQKNGVPKDAEHDAQTTGHFVYNFVGEDLAVAMNLSAAEIPRLESEFGLSSLALEEGKYVNAPIVRDSPIKLECKYLKSVPVGSFAIAVGEVVGIQIAQDVISDGAIDAAKLKPIMRMGFSDEYCTPKTK